jgi:branched-chain amino acid transport system permease protein
MRLVNLAHGDLIVLAAYLIPVAVTVLGLHPLLALLLAAPLMFAVGWGLQREVLTRTLGEDILPPLLVTFGLSIVSQNALLEGFSADSQRLRLGEIETASVALGPLNVGPIPLFTFASAVAVAVIFALNQLFYPTALGRAFRAVSDDRVTAQLMGIRPTSVFATATGVAMVVVTIAALYLGVRSNFDPTIGPARLIIAFEAVIIGVAQTLGGAINPEWQIPSGRIAFLIVLLVRPRGLFPRAQD